MIARSPVKLNETDNCSTKPLNDTSYWPTAFSSCHLPSALIKLIHFLPTYLNNTSYGPTALSSSSLQSNLIEMTTVLHTHTNRRSTRPTASSSLLPLRNIILFYKPALVIRRLSLRPCTPVPSRQL